MEPRNPYDLYDGEIPFWDERAARHADDDGLYEEYDIELEEEPSVEEVVYCRRCKWRGVPYDKEAHRGCVWTEEDEPEDDDFCSFGTECEG